MLSRTLRTGGYLRCQTNKRNLTRHGSRQSRRTDLTTAPRASIRHSSTEQFGARFEERSKVVNKLKAAVQIPGEGVWADAIPTYSLLTPDGKINNKEEFPEFSDEFVLKIYRQMVLLNTMDTKLHEVQRQGRISFYMPSKGEEATHFGSAVALEPADTIFAQYREQGVFMYRGFSLDDFCNQCFSNAADKGKGRQMPVHYGSKALNIQTISSPLGTQLPQAVGSAYAQKMRGEKNCTIVYFGEGAASEGDFHPAMNFAATLQAPTIFFCRNNGYAISTPSIEQYRGDGIAGRGIAYGMHTIRVDGNDFFAVYNATKKAREIAVTKQIPVMLEAMTYRIGDHSTSDDSTRYREGEEVAHWTNTSVNPIIRLREYLERKNIWDADKETALKKDSLKQVLASIKNAELRPKPHIDGLFTDVYHDIPPHLAQQQADLQRHLKKYPDKYPIDSHTTEL
mmetsp:Transcript_10413/g.11459  ORF Transcript_10413/g.11459 Transcript_10413/m.11459 type:complete len:453 (+) Transcript_10413:113-1471(+)